MSKRKGARMHGKATLKLSVLPTTDHDDPKGRGKFTYYPGKVGPPITLNFQPDTRRGLSTLVDRIGVSRNDLIEHGNRKLLGLPVNPELDAKIIEARAKIREAR